MVRFAFTRDDVVSIRRADVWAFERELAHTNNSKRALVSIRRADVWAFERSITMVRNGFVVEFQSAGRMFGLLNLT